MSTDHEFKIHHLVGELVPLLRVQDSSGVDSLAELLLKHRSPYVTTQVSYQLIQYWACSSLVTWPVCCR